ncbi:hypothetical protein KP509_05G086900 [Ceratopteris richardii]|uniref:Pseudo response regulator 1 n=1 Tax=Ceratopteris richardii TaxID=49495 RepID=A0A8T2V0H4_CERRI|nr:hypothetical protein KP509_05G086900 [Ceratopteris richardii]
MGHGGDGPIDPADSTLDRSQVHILLCDKDPQSGLDVMTLLQKCSYRVTCVKSAGQVMQVLDSSGSEVDLILAEVELPKEKGFKLLKHIVRQKQLQRIPVVMMSAQDEMAMVVRCLKLGAVDFLLKPLRRNELLNLWTHTWRRQRMLGLTERHFMKGNLRVPFDLLVSETSESNNTNSTNLFSDDTEDHRVTATISIQTPQRVCDAQHDLSPRLELSLKPLVEVTVEVTSEHGAGLIPSPPRKSELKPSARLVQVQCFDTGCSNLKPHCQIPEMQTNSHEIDEPSTKNTEVSCLNTSMVGLEEQDVRLSSFIAGSQEDLKDKHSNHWKSISRNENECNFRCQEPSASSENHVAMQADFLGCNLNLSDPYHHDGGGVGTPSRYLVGGMIGPVMHCPPPMISPAVHMYQNSLTEDGYPAAVAAGIPKVHMHQSLNLRGNFPFYSFGLPLAASSAQINSLPSWHPGVLNPVLERKLGQAERREAALKKFRRKRKDRCFEKKIRYISRKKLAEQRPRIKGQFVRREADMDTNDFCVMDDYEDDEDDQALCDMGEESSPESVAEEA